MVAEVVEQTIARSETHLPEVQQAPRKAGLGSDRGVVSLQPGLGIEQSDLHVDQTLVILFEEPTNV